MIGFLSITGSLLNLTIYLFFSHKQSVYKPKLSSCFCQVSLFFFLDSWLIATKIWNNSLNGLKQQTSYSSVHLKQIDLSLDKHSQDMGAGDLKGVFFFPATAATAKSLQSCLTLCDPVPGILQARTLEGVAISFSNA